MNELLLENEDNTENQMSPAIQNAVCVVVYFFQTLFRLSDTSINVLFQFLSLYFKFLGRIFSLTIFQSIHQSFPQNLINAHRFTRDDFQKCALCHSIYPKDNCVKRNTFANVEESVMHVYRISKSSTCKQEERVRSTSNEISFRKNLIPSKANLRDKS